MILTEDDLKMKDMLKMLVDNARQLGREDTINDIRDIFSPQGSFKGRIYFDDVEELITELKLRRKAKNEGQTTEAENLAIRHRNAG